MSKGISAVLKCVLVTIILISMVFAKNTSTSAGVITKDKVESVFKGVVLSHDYRTMMLYIFDYIDNNNITSPRRFFRDVYEIKDETLTMYINELQKSYSPSEHDYYSTQEDLYSFDIIIAYIKN